jgi:hypothetical protein
VQGINDSLFARCDQSALNHFPTDSPWGKQLGRMRGSAKTLIGGFKS